MEAKYQYQIVNLPKKKRIALVAHDHRKPDLLEWAKLTVGS